MNQINHDRPVSIYDCKTKRVIGIFSSPSMVARYVYDAYSVQKSTVICEALKRRGAILKNKFNIKIAVRYSTDEQVNILSSNDYLVFTPYPQPLKRSMRSADLSRISMQEEFMKRRHPNISNR